MPLAVAQLAYCILTLGLIAALAWVALRLGGWRTSPERVLFAATLLLASRPGEWALVLGQFAALAALATSAALYFGGSRPLLAAVALAVSMFKPTFGVPVAALMLGRGQRRAVIVGVSLAATVSLCVMAVLAISCSQPWSRATSGDFKPS